MTNCVGPTEQNCCLKCGCVPFFEILFKLTYVLSQRIVVFGGGGMAVLSNLVL